MFPQKCSLFSFTQIPTWKSYEGRYSWDQLQGMSQHCHAAHPEGLQQTTPNFPFWASRCTFCPLLSSDISVTILQLSLTRSPCCESDHITHNGTSGLADYGDNVGDGHSLAKVYINFNYYLQLSAAHTSVQSQTPLLSFARNSTGRTYNLPLSSSFFVFIFILLFLQLQYSQFKCW